ncbi:protein hunchback [Drosophila innubila]|uniref:protein hunchback n=1 Tax=Drosophila innubila TaxID=198719 RepID=UPI00148CCB9A|nr:protein hunchback [Drosophila innubila]
MQNWETSTASANYEQHNAWYNSMFAANIKQEPISHHHHQQHHDSNSNNSCASSPRQSPHPPSTQLEQYLKQQHQQQQQHQQPMDTLCGAAMTPSPSNNDQNSLQHFDATLQQQLLQQQQYQQHFQAAQQQQQQQQQHHHLALGGFNPLTPPGLPNPMQHYYASNMRPSPQPTPTTAVTAATVVGVGVASGDKLQALTPPMDVTPPKSPAKSQQSNTEPEKEHDLMSNSSEDMKYMAESEDDDTNIRMPIYNSHGKMKNYKCKTCGVVAITKVDFWAHTRTHMKPDKILQCAKCPFVTEFKHHLEYHIRKHKNQKPFQCDKCSYTCVNKSMLNSHRKSHSSVYQYRCADCDYATKYCHSFKLHLRKYGHKPGMVLDEDGTPNPSLVIDVYGTRRGPKSKSVSGSSSSGCSGSSKRSSSSIAPPTAQQQQQHQQQQTAATSQLSAALQGFPLPATAAVAPPSASSAVAVAVPAASPPSPAKSVASSEQAASLPSALLPPLASLLQQNRNMAFFPYWNLNLQMLAAQQQAAVLAQLSPRMHDQLQQQHQQQQQQQQQQQHLNLQHSDNEEDEEHEDDFERKSVDSAMDLSQGTPVKEDLHQHLPHSSHMAMNLKVKDEDTPLISSSTASRRKGRVLKLDTLLQLKSAAMSSPEQQPKQPTASSPIAGGNSGIKQLADDPCSGASSADESMETSHVPQVNISASSTASSSGNSSNASSNAAPASTTASASASASATASVSSSSSATGSSSNSNSNNNSPAIYECKYCDIYFKDAVLYTIHMGYHSCDDVFKCNMCGEKCDGPVGLFVHMARNAHS